VRCLTFVSITYLKMKVLFITTDNYPEFGTTVNIIKKLIYEGNLLDRIDDIGVVTFKRKWDDNECERIDNVQVYRTHSFVGISISEFLSDIINKVNIFCIVRFCWVKICMKIQNMIFKSPFLRKEDINAIYKVLKKVNADSYDFIIPIFGNHAAVAAVMKYRPQNAKLILYQVDPCSTNWTRSKWEYKRSLKFEMRMYKAASAIITMPVIFEEVQSLIELGKKNKFYPMELPLVSVDCNEEKGKEEKRKIQCVFSGLIYAGIRDPLYTLKLFEGLIKESSVTLHLVGVKKEELPKAFSDYDIKCYGRVNAEQAQTVMRQADILINIGNLMTNQVPSKIFDYISMGKPIVNVCKNKKCPTLSYLRKYPLVLNLFEIDELLDLQKEELASFIRINYLSRIDLSVIKDMYKELTPEYCASEIYKVLKMYEK